MFGIISFSKNLQVICLVVTALASCIDGAKVTIRKCCPEGDVIDVSVMKCRDSGSLKWSPTFSKADDEDGGAEVGNDGYEIQSKIPNCPGSGVHIIPLRDLEEHSIFAAKFRLLKSGNVIAKHVNGYWLNVENFCIDGLQNFGESGDSYSGNENDQALLTCPLMEDEK